MTPSLTPGEYLDFDTAGNAIARNLKLLRRKAEGRRLKPSPSLEPKVSGSIELKTE